MNGRAPLTSKTNATMPRNMKRNRYLSSFALACVPDEVICMAVFGCWSAEVGYRGDSLRADASVFLLLCYLSVLAEWRPLYASIPGLLHASTPAKRAKETTSLLVNASLSLLQKPCAYAGLCLRRNVQRAAGILCISDCATSVRAQGPRFV